MPRAHSRKLFQDCSTKGIPSTIKAEMEVTSFNIEKMENTIARKEEEIAALVKNLEENLKPQLATEKVRIIFFKFAKATFSKIIKNTKVRIIFSKFVKV